MRNCTLLLAGLFFSGILLSQHTTEKKAGYSVTTITSKDIGDIKVYLPDDLRAGETISGTVSISPSGKKEKDIEKNRQILINSTVTIGNDGFPVIARVSGSIKLNKDEIDNLPVKITAADGSVLYQTVLHGLFTNLGSVASSFRTPTHILSGSPFKISGPFDGIASNTQCRLDGKELELLAESPRLSVFQMPTAASGPHTITIEENGKVTEQKTSCVNLEMVADKTNLRTGQKAIITATITGLQDLPAAATLTMSNISSNTVTLIGGNTQSIIISPSQVSAAGIYTQSFTVQSLTTGNFTVSADLQLPGADEEKTSTASLCNCYINQRSYLLPLDICSSLGGSTDPLIQSTTPQPDQTPPHTTYPVITIKVPPTSNAADNTIRLQVLDFSDQVAAVLFSEKSVSGNTWYPVGAAQKEGNAWNAEWTAPLGNDGEHILRARIADKNNKVTEVFAQTLVQITPYSINPVPGEKINLTVSNQQIKDADQKTKRITDNLNRLQEKLDSLKHRYNELRQSQEENATMAAELAAIDKVIDQIKGLFADPLKALIDALNKLKENLPDKVDPEALQKAADDAAQRQKDCEDRLNKLKAEKEQAQKELDDLNEQIENLLDQMDALHLGNNWIGGHGYHADGGFWYGYVGDERSNTNITAESNAIGKKLRDLKGPQNKANNRVKNLNKEIVDAEAECDKLKKEKEKADQAVKDGDQYAATETQIDELCRQIESLMSALQDWLAAHPGISGLDAELPPNPRTPEELDAYLDKLDDIIKKKQQKEAELKQEAEDNAAETEETEEQIQDAEAEKDRLENDQANAQAEADKLRTEREKQLEAERAKQRQKQQEEEIRRNTPKPAPTLPEAIYPSEKQIKFQAISMLRGLHQDYWIKYGPCDCRTKALALANKTNTAAQDVLGGIAIGVMFAPLEAFPGLSLATKLGLGAAKAIGSALYGGENFTDELAKNLFNVIGGEIFPKLTGSDIAGSSVNTFAGKGLEEIMKDEGIRSGSWEGEAEIRGCGTIKGKTTMLFNPNTGWVTLLIKIDNCPLIVVKYRVNKDGVAISTPTVTKVG